MESREKANRHVHSGKTSRGDFDPRQVLLMAGIKKGQTMIDAGCGDGHISMAASEVIGPEGSVQALDIHGPSIKGLIGSIKEKGYGNIYPQRTDITLGFDHPDSSVDMVMMSNVLHGLVNNDGYGHVLKDVTRVLRHGGRFVVIEFKKVDTGFGPPSSFRIGTEDVCRLIAGLGMRTLDTIEISPAHYMAIFYKELE
jgi:ubiquinone/menaquinone biosynthesis C-methylase UbiE